MAVIFKMLGVATRGKGSAEFGIGPPSPSGRLQGQGTGLTLGRLSFIYIEPFSLNAEPLNFWGMSTRDIMIMRKQPLLEINLHLLRGNVIPVSTW